MRRQKVNELLGVFKYYEKQLNLSNAREKQKEAQVIFNQKKEEEETIKNSINELENEINALKPKAEVQAVEHINNKLRGTVPWRLDYYEDNLSGYYWIAQKNVNGVETHRGVKELSTGEKNIIALLYFIEKLEEINNNNNESKVIVFDDPMNSNDAEMQYLIITELQKLYQGKIRKSFDPQKDYIVVMTHNVHFYLNVPPHGAYKDGNGKTKYDKNNFYRIQNGNFICISSESEDFKTNYDAIWSELENLAKYNLKNSMLNSMRRIIETYLEFTGISQSEFYHGNEQYLKLFNVNSHSAIDDLSAEAFTESADELMTIFHQIFIDNNADAHFKAHWHG